MKSFKLYNGKRDKFSLRKKNVGLVSIAIASLAIYGLAIGAPTVQADENSSVNAVSTENVTAPASTDTTAAAGLASEVSTPSTSVSTTEVPVSEGTSAGAENNSSPAPATVSENAASASGATAVEKVETPAQTTGQPDEKVSVPTTSSVAESTNKVSADTSTSAAVAKGNSASAEPKPIEQSTNAQSYSAFRSAGAVRTRRSVKEASSHISDFSVTVTTKGGTVMNPGDTEPLPAQEVSLDKVQMDFKITQDGTLKKGDVLRIPVKLENNAYGAYYANLGSGTAERIEGVGTIKFVHSDPNNLAYEITLDQSFQDMPRNTEKTVSITQKAATIGKFTAKSSYENIILEINGNKFTFKPTPRTFEKAQANFAVYNSASSDRANSIKIGTSTGDANYYNNLLSSDGTNSGQTGIPNGDIISVHRIKPSNGSKIVSIKPDLKRYTSTLAISEDGKYLVKGDTSTSISINSDPDNKLVELPANSTDEEIVKALKQAGKNSSVVIDNGDGTYTVAINLGKMTGNGATTYHDIWPTDDYAQMGDKYQEINRTEEVNRKVSSILKNANVIQGTGHSTRITFADSSIENALGEGSKSFSYSVDDNGTIKKIKEEKLSAKTTPSIARAVGQKKITIHYVDTNGKELETRDFKYGYPAGAMAPQTPDYQAAPKTIAGYSLVTADTVINAYGSQLKEAKPIPFINEDQNFYYVYSPKQSYAKVKYIDDDAKGEKVLETKELTGAYNTTDPYKTAETIKKYTDKNYELVSDNYPATGVTYNENLQTFEVHLRHKTAPEVETKTVKETIQYVYENGSEAATPKVQNLDFNRTNTKDLVTNDIVNEGTWSPSTATFPAVTSPVLAGYTADLPTVDAVANISATSSDVERKVVYKANEQKLTYTVIDETKGQTLEDKVLLEKGVSNGAVSGQAQTTYDAVVAGYLAQNYELVSQEALPNQFDTNDTVDQNVTIRLRHKTTSVAEEKTVKETIHYIYDGGATAAPDHTSTLKFTRTATTDLVTNITTGDWTAENGTSFAAVTSPAIKGYTPDLAEVPAVDNITSDSPNIEKTVVYKANPASAKVTYIDDTTGETLETKALNGLYGQTDPYRTAATIKKYTDRNYGLVSDGYPATGVTYNENLQTFEVHLRHKGAAVQETKTVTETIKYVYEDNTEAADTKVQTLKFYRINNKDLVTNKIVYKGPWILSTGTFPEVVSPKIDGYTPDKAKVDAEHVTADQTDIKVTVKYKADKQKVTYTIIDDTTHTTLKNKVELTTGDSGANLPDDAQTKYDKAVDDYLAKGYELVSKDNLPTQFDTDSSVDQNVVVHLKHKVTASTENTTVTETIHYVYKDGSQAAESHKATLDFAREVRTDEVTKAVTKGAWSPSTSTFVAVTSPIIAGYTADKPVVEAVDGIIGDSKDVVVKVTYTADKQKVTYTVIDETTQKTLENQVELTTGDSDSALPTTAKTKYEQIVKGYTDKGYELISKDDLPAKFDKDSTKDQNVVIRLKHSTTDNKESKKVSLTVRYHGAGSQTPANNVQTATWTRIVTKDKVTGDVVKTTDWTADKANYNAVPSPVISGYTVDVATVPQEKVTQEDIVKDVHYGIQTQKVTYTVIDDTTGTTLENQVELTTGHSGTNLPTDAQTKYDRIVKGYTDKGYELVSKDDLPAQFDKDSSVDQNVVVHLKHKVTTSSEIKTIKETIHYVYQNGSEARSSYGTSLSFTREVKTDEVTKLSTKGSWSPVTGTFAAVTSPMITGYTADKPIVAAVDGITGDSEDIVETVVYKANQERAQVRYIDDTTGATLETKELTGDYNTTDSYRTADTISHYTSQGYELVSDNYPSTGVIYNETYQKFEVHLKHGTAESQESKKVSLTVRYHGAGSQTPADNVQTVTWTRTVTKDKVTGDVVKTTDWVADKATYDAVPSPVIPGYTVDVATVSAETVTQEDMVKDVYYTAIPVTPDKPTPPVVPSTPDKPTTPTVVPTTPTKATPTKTEILPSTGDSQVGPTLATLTGVSLLLSAFGYIGRRKKED
ncbi:MULTISPECIES: YSIRK signal domain/LPXTG anchor domain surface protein [Streptococcus]|uniref:YSIRK signal domain/LPXTG anchor domain surface protein n=1 Tax=Streptococcus TaxID=1301 RepID=UPI0004493D2F|nr:MULTISPECIES: YSIRK signal domain/LPXTG anchor domain surface protein [Streptococcus]EUC76244.1 Gram-positive signal peptide protein, YSIRK family [Streptococcus sp. CM7]MDX5092715.1 YSIRK signal domain/LPXTG anchor domain surface protein [Streptococcus anginosus]OFL62695.1 cell wall protein [Streptococcus sp. HMSC061D01]